MKQRLFKVLFVCMAVAFLPQVAHAAGDVEINATNFPDGNFRSYLLEQDYGKDGVLTEDEIKDITFLYIWYKDIRSLKGIEYFTALIELDCSINQLTSLDVSKNIALTYLGCYSNQLTALDVSKNTTLIQLNCGNNQLTALDVSKNTKLETLDVYSNKIKGASMDNLINSLPRYEYPRGKFMIYSSLPSDEGNVCTKEQVKAAKEKGWIAYYSHDYDENGYWLWEEYEGSDDTSSNIDGIRTEAGKDAPVYNLRGERLTAPQKGVNIIGGRKVVVK